MPTQDEKKIAHLVDRFIEDSLSGTPPDPKDYLSHCPKGSEEELEQALGAVQHIVKYHWEPNISDELVDEGIRRLTALRDKKQRLAVAEQGLSSIVSGVLRQPVDLVAGLFGWQNPAGEGGLQGGNLVPATASVMYRGRTGTARVNDWIVQNAQLEMHERSLCEKAEDLLRRTLAAKRTPIDIDAIAKSLFLMVKDVALEDMDGCLVSNGELGAILVNKALSKTQRRRFTVGHEIAHFVLHKTTLVMRGHFSDLGKDFQNFDCSDWSEELEANLFASFLLMPPMLLSTDFGSAKPTFQDIEELSEEFDVSLAAAARRLVRASHWRSALVVSSDGHVVWHALSKQFEGWQRPHQTLRDGTAAYLLSNGANTDSISEKMPATFWFEGDIAQEDVEVSEESKRLGDGYVYTLLTVLD